MGRFVCEGEQMGVKRTRNEQDFLEERIHFVWTASPSFLLFLLAAATGSAVVLTGKGLQGLLVCVMEAV